MRWDEFRKKYNARECEKCCGSCKHGYECGDGAYVCDHPELDKGESFVVSEGEVCNAWEGN